MKFRKHFEHYIFIAIFSIWFVLQPVLSFSQEIPTKGNKPNSINDIEYIAISKSIQKSTDESYKKAKINVKLPKNDIENIQYIMAQISQANDLGEVNPLSEFLNNFLSRETPTVEGPIHIKTFQLDQSNINDIENQLRRVLPENVAPALDVVFRELNTSNIQKIIDKVNGGINNVLNRIINSSKILSQNERLISMMNSVGTNLFNVLAKSILGGIIGMSLGGALGSTAGATLGGVFTSLLSGILGGLISIKNSI